MKAWETLSLPGPRLRPRVAWGYAARRGLYLGVSLWKKATTLGKIIVNRRELEAQLEKALSELREQEANLKSQTEALAVARAEIEKDRRNLASLERFMRETFSAPVVSVRDFIAAKRGILETADRLRRAERQLNTSAAVIKSLRARIEHGQAGAAVMLKQLKALGRVIPWTKPKR